MSDMQIQMGGLESFMEAVVERRIGGTMEEAMVERRIEGAMER